MSEVAIFSSVLDYIYEIYKYPANKNIKVFELQRLESEIIRNGFKNKGEPLARISYLINELNKLKERE